MKVPDPGRLARSLFEESADALFLVDPVGVHITDANVAAARLCGRSRDELIGLAADQLFQPTGTRGALSDALRLREHRDVPYGYVLSDDDPDRDVPLHLRYVPADGSDPPLLIARAARPPASEAEHTLREGQERLTRIVETVADGILLVDCDQRITFANTAAERMTGLPRRRLTAVCWHELRWEAD